MQSRMRRGRTPGAEADGAEAGAVSQVAGAEEREEWMSQKSFRYADCYATSESACGDEPAACETCLSSTGAVVIAWILHPSTAGQRVPRTSLLASCHC